MCITKLECKNFRCIWSLQENDNDQKKEHNRIACLSCPSATCQVSLGRSSLVLLDTYPLSYVQQDSLLLNVSKNFLEQDLYFGLSPALMFFSLTSDQTLPYFESKCPLLWRISGTSPSLTECISPLPLRMPYCQPVSLCALGFVFVFTVFWTLGDGSMTSIIICIP